VVQLKAIEQPRGTYASLADVFVKALEQEQGVSREIDSLYELAFREKAFAAVAELQWFLTEQVEEEKTAREIVAKFKLIDGDPAATIDLDRELGERVVAAAPSPTAAT
jgi:ferritin